MIKIIFLFLLVSVMTGCSYSNMIKNPGAELSPADSNWTSLSGRWTHRSVAPLPQKGKSYFFPGVAANAELAQDVDVSNYAFFIDNGLISADYSGYVRSYPQRPADESAEMLKFINKNGEVIDSFKTKYYDSTNAWVHIVKKMKLPGGTRAIRVTLISKRNKGSNNDGYHDNLSLTLSNSLSIYFILLLIIIVAGGMYFFYKRNKRQRKLH